MGCLSQIKQQKPKKKRVGVDEYKSSVKSPFSFTHGIKAAKVWYTWYLVEHAVLT